MFKRVLSILSLACVLLASSGCAVQRIDATDASEKRGARGFDRVEFAGFGQLEVREGEHYSVEVSGPRDAVEKLRTKVDDHTLVIKWDNALDQVSLLAKPRSFKVVVVTPKLKGLKVSGAGDAEVQGFRGGDLKLESSGAGAIKCSDVSLGKLTVKLTGAGSAECLGQAREQEIELSGAGDYDGQELKSERVQLTLSGAGDATVWVTKKLDATLSGAASVYYYGDPKVTKTVSGAGKVERKGSK